jgi:sugar phosphate isomerase/epimerase
MKLSVTTLGWPACTLDKVLEDLRNAGGFAGLDFRGLGDEMDITKLPEFNEKLDETMAAIADAGLTVSGLSTSARLVSRKGGRSEDEVPRYAKLADRMGVKFLRVFGGQRRDDQDRDAWMAEAVENLKTMVDSIADTGAVVVIETHDDWSHSADLAELLDKVDSPKAAALWDVLITCLMGKEAPAESVKNLGSRIQYTHVKDGVVKGGKFGISMVGEGEVDLPGAVAELKSAGYDGWLTFEWEKRWHPEIPDAAEALPAYRKVIEPLL